jgi:hypothetical protein
MVVAALFEAGISIERSEMSSNWRNISKDSKQRKNSKNNK